MPDQAFYKDLPRRLRVVKATGWTLHDFPCPHGCYFHDDALGQPCCQGMCCKGNGDTPEARAARKLAEAVAKRLAARTVRLSFNRITGRPELDGLTAQEARLGADNLVMYLQEFGDRATRDVIEQARERTTTRSSAAAGNRAARVIGR